MGLSSQFDQLQLRACAPSIDLFLLYQPYFKETLNCSGFCSVCVLSRAVSIDYPSQSHACIVFYRSVRNQDRFDRHEYTSLWPYGKLFRFACLFLSLSVSIPILLLSKQNSKQVYSLTRKQCTKFSNENFSVKLLENLHAGTYDIAYYIYKVKKFAAASVRLPAAARRGRRDRHSRA